MKRYCGVALVTLACVGCSSSPLVIDPDLIEGSAWVIVSDLQGDIIYAQECAGPVDELVCSDAVVTAGISVNTGASLSYPIIGTFQLEVDAYSAIEENETSSRLVVSPRLGPWILPALEIGDVPEEVEHEEVP